MTVTQAELARRLKSARENVGLTQLEVAEAVGLARTAVVQIEAGHRAISSLELEKLARLYGRDMREFLSESAFDADPVVALFRVTPGFANDLALTKELRDCAHLCREATQLERLLDLPLAYTLSASYAVEAPSSRWEAICQGRYLAEQERSRLGLGLSPLWQMAEALRRQGVRVTETAMPEDVSGLFFHSRDIGLVIVVNRSHSLSRRRFSYAHEFCHLLVDRARPGIVSRQENRDELIEVRANAFAAHFLMPEAGVRAFLQTLGKGESTRQVQEVYDGVESVAAQKRLPPGSQEIQVHDVVELAHHFGVSYEAALYHLLNLRLLTKEQQETLLAQREVAKSVSRALRLPRPDNESRETLAEQILALSLEAYRRGLISRRKLLELADAAKVSAAEMEAILASESFEAEPVDAVLPE